MSRRFRSGKDKLVKFLTYIQNAYFTVRMRDITVTGTTVHIYFISIFLLLSTRAVTFANVLWRRRRETIRKISIPDGNFSSELCHTITRARDTMKFAPLQRRNLTVAVCPLSVTGVGAIPKAQFAQSILTKFPIEFQLQTIGK